MKNKLKPKFQYLTLKRKQIAQLFEYANIHIMNHTPNYIISYLNGLSKDNIIDMLEKVAKKTDDNIILILAKDIKQMGETMYQYLYEYVKTHGEIHNRINNLTILIAEDNKLYCEQYITRKVKNLKLVEKHNIQDILSISQKFERFI